MYERSRTVVRCAVGQTEEFKVEVGLHQGSALSPFLFAIVMDQLSEEVRQESPWTMMFADDIVICSESWEQVEENLERWRFALERRGMKVSGSKTEYMCVNEREGSGTVRLQGKEVKKVQEFKYLGSTVQSNGECGKEWGKKVFSQPPIVQVLPLKKMREACNFHHSLDLNTGSWTADNDNDKAVNRSLSYSRDTLKKKDPPTASVLQKHSPSPEVVCHATGFFPKAVNISWRKDGEDVNEDVELRETLLNQDGSFQKRSILKVPAEELQKHNYTCVIQHSSLKEELNERQILSGWRNTFL
ncbi:hypothetical protein QTP70_000704 [Hemibagrus guttatus]|uniref:ribonuclease H n=1 Tax=Hemibagrus guttatus TaxID=175788 RepID=A0AAE0Q5I2_9TELE|nr:hypothetical protein QTP70_000704 [Hemibagrus guttatus]